MRHEIVRDPRGQRVDRLGPNRAFDRPATTFVQMVPQRTQTLVPALARIVIAEPVERDLPHWTELGDEQAFAKRYPNVINDEIAHLEVGDGEGARPRSTSRMLSR